MALKCITENCRNRGCVMNKHNKNSSSKNKSCAQQLMHLCPPPFSPSASAGLRIMGSWLHETGAPRPRGGSSASGPASVGSAPTAPRGWAQSWTDAAAARAARGRSETRATRGMSATRTRACTATSQPTSRDTRSECVHVSGSRLFWIGHVG